MDHQRCLCLSCVYINDVGKCEENRRNIVGRTGLGSNHSPDHQQESYLAAHWRLTLNPIFVFEYGGNSAPY